jgi:hypothetical protein
MTQSGHRTNQNAGRLSLDTFLLALHAIYSFTASDLFNLSFGASAVIDENGSSSRKRSGSGFRFHNFLRAYIVQQNQRESAYDQKYEPQGG